MHQAQEGELGARQVPLDVDMNKHDGQPWFFSDPHFFHGNIIKYCMRPFMTSEEYDIMTLGSKEERRKLRISKGSIESMNDTIVNNINSCVDRNDTLYCLGDFVLGTDATKGAQVMLDRLVCKQVNLIYGNHDKRRVGRLFSSAKDLATVKVRAGGAKQAIVLCHYPLMGWDKQHHGAWHLFGHFHGDDPPGADLLKSILAFDVGMDCHGFMPLNFTDIKEIMDTKSYRPAYRHG